MDNLIENEQIWAIVNAATPSQNITKLQEIAALPNRRLRLACYQFAAIFDLRRGSAFEATAVQGFLKAVDEMPQEKERTAALKQALRSATAYGMPAARGLLARQCIARVGNLDAKEEAEQIANFIERPKRTRRLSSSITRRLKTLDF